MILFVIFLINDGGFLGVWLKNEECLKRLMSLEFPKPKNLMILNEAPN
jgi:hypothetical protein